MILSTTHQTRCLKIQETGKKHIQNQEACRKHGGKCQNMPKMFPACTQQKHPNIIQHVFHTFPKFLPSGHTVDGLCPV